MSDSSGDEGALQIDIGGGSENVRGRGNKSTTGRARKGWNTGDVVWAKVTGFNYWPAKVFDAVNDPLVPGWLKHPPRPTYMLVRFFGTYDMQWVSSNSAESFEKGLKKKFHNKSRRKIFLKAIQEARLFLNEGSLSEGMTVRPPDPDPAEEEESTNKPPESKLPKDPQPIVDTQQDPQPTVDTQQDPQPTVDTHIPNHTYTCTIPPTPKTNTPVSGSRRRKGSTPRRLSSSSSAPSSEAGDTSSEVKKVKVDDGVEAFTCAPLPLSTGAEK